MEVKVFNKLFKRSVNDYKAMEKIYKYYYKRAVYRLCGIYTREIAEDAVQEFFLKLRDIASSQDWVENPASWIYNRCEEYAKKILEEENMIVEFSQNELGSYGVTYILDNEVEELLGSLPEEIDRTILRMAYFEGYSYREIADKLNMSHDAVRQRAVRATRRIKRYSNTDAQLSLYKQISYINNKIREV